MGGIINDIFGGGSNKATKQAAQFNTGVYNDTKSLTSPYTTGGAADFGAFNGALTGTDGGQGLQNYLNSTGYKFTTGQGTQAIENSQAAHGLLNSGATAKALDTYGENMGQTYYQNYLNNLFQGSQLGMQGVQTQANAGSNASNSNANILQTGATQRANGVGNMLNFGLGIAGLI